MKKLIIITLIIPLFTVSCLEDFFGYQVYEKEDQEVFFEYTYINYAWGMQYNHWILDNEGKVRTLSNRDSIISIDPSELNSYIDYFDSVICQVDTAELKLYSSYIEEAASGKIDSTEMHMADFGGYKYSCFFWNGNDYERITLSSLSDILQEENSNSKAQLIDKWLKGIELAGK